jgi:hypothetical protein
MKNMFGKSLLKKHQENLHVTHHTYDGFDDSTLGSSGDHSMTVDLSKTKKQRNISFVTPVPCKPVAFSMMPDTNVVSNECLLENMARKANAFSSDAPTSNKKRSIGFATPLPSTPISFQRKQQIPSDESRRRLGLVEESCRANHQRAGVSTFVTVSCHRFA